MRVVVTGGCGFIGSHLVDLLVRKQNQVLVLDDLSSGVLERIQPHLEVQRSQVNFELYDISRPDRLQEIFRRFQPWAVCHLAAQPAIGQSWEHPVRNACVNELGTLYIAQAAKESGCSHIVLASTSAVYPNLDSVLSEDSPLDPSSPYGLSKLAAECYVRWFSNGVILRLGNVYGPRQIPIGDNQVVPKMMLHMLRGETFAIHGDGKQERDFVHVSDVAMAFLHGIYAAYPGTYNIASGTSTTVNDLARMVAHSWGLNGAGYAWNHDGQSDDRRSCRLAVSRAERELGWKSRRTLPDGIRETTDWWKTVG